MAGHGLSGLRERPRPGQPRRLDRAAEQLLTTLLDIDPQARGSHATGWTVPLLRTELAQAGYPVRTIRQTLHRLGWRWKRPQYVLGRPDPDYERKRGGNGPERCWPQAAKSGGGGDETTLREFPPLRAAWSRRGQQAEVVIRGRNARRVIVGVLNVTTGQLVRVVRERSRGQISRPAWRPLGERRLGNCGC